MKEYKKQSLARSGDNFDRKAYISQEAANEIEWWIRNIFDAFALIKLAPFDLIIFSDASLQGWGGTDQVTHVGGRWNCIENKCHTNSLEYQVALFCLKAFCKNKTRLHVLLKRDNTKAVAPFQSLVTNEIKWWIRNIFDAFALIKLATFDLIIFSDASLQGWGGTDQVTQVGGRWNCIENKCHTNSLEYQVALFCLKAFCKNKTRLHVLLKRDNTKAVAHINKKGGTISVYCNK